MSARSGIPKAFAAGLKESLDGTGSYVNNVYENVGNRVLHFDQINDFPYISVTPGPEVREDLPSNFSWSTLTVYFKIYVQNADDAQGELESIISDIENYVDTHLNLSYNVTTPSGLVTRETTDNSIVSITTDEGILDPNALGEIVLDVRYEKIREH